MPIDDFINWTPKHCKRIIHEWQITKDERLFSLLLAKYDRYLIKISWGFHKKIGVTLEDLYHSSIIGFGIAMTKFEHDDGAGMIMAVITSYVKREIESRYITRKPNESKELQVAQLNPVNSADILDSQMIMNSDYLSSSDKKLLSLRFEEGMSFKKIGEHLGICTRAASKRVLKVLERIRVAIGVNK